MIYNVFSDKYIFLDDKDNYKSIDITASNHCVFKNNCSSNILNNNYNDREYISLSSNHASLFNNLLNKMYKLQLKVISHEEEKESEISPYRIFTTDFVCHNLGNRNCMLYSVYSLILFCPIAIVCILH